MSSVNICPTTENKTTCDHYSLWVQTQQQTNQHLTPTHSGSKHSNRQNNIWPLLTLGPNTTTDKTTCDHYSLWVQVLLPFQVVLGVPLGPAISITNSWLNISQPRAGAGQSTGTNPNYTTPNYRQINEEEIMYYVDFKCSKNQKWKQKEQKRKFGKLKIICPSEISREAKNKGG